jgi:hypothetical protein
MTEERLVTLRVHAARMADEAARFQRMLVSVADESLALEHLGNVETAAALCRQDGWPVEPALVADVAEVLATTVVAIAIDKVDPPAPAPEQKGRKKR